MPHSTLVVYLNRQYFVNNTLENVSNYLNPVLHGSSGRILKGNSEILWTPDSKSWLTGKDPDAGKYWRQEENGMTDWYHRLNGHEFEQALGDGEGWGSLVCYIVHGVTGVGHDWATEQQQ